MQEVADILTQENNALKLEVDMYHRKVAKLQRVSVCVYVSSVPSDRESVPKNCLCFLQEFLLIRKPSLHSLTPYPYQNSYTSSFKVYHLNATHLLYSKHFFVINNCQASEQY